MGEAENGQKGVELFKQTRPDLVLLDFKMPVMTGDLALGYILDEDPNAYVVLLSSVRDWEEVRGALMAGAQDYLTKDSPPETIRAALQEQIEKIKANPG